MTIMVLISMRRCISNENRALDGFLSPVHVKGDFESTLHVLWKVVTTISFDLADKGLDIINIIGERFHFKSSFVFDVSETNERYTASQLSIGFALLDSLIDNFTKHLLSFIDP